MTQAHFYTRDELDAADRDKLDIIAEARGLQVTGTGARGKVLVGDLVAAIEADQDAAGVNPALEPVPAEPTPKRYRVEGTRKVLGNEPGSEFVAILQPAHEARLLRCHLSIVAEDPQVSPDEPVADEDDGMTTTTTTDAADPAGADDAGSDDTSPPDPTDKEQ